VNEQVEIIGKKLLKRADLVATGLLVGLLVLVGSLYLQEASATLPEYSPPGAPPWNEQIPSAEFSKVEEQFLKAQPAIAEDTRIRRIVQLNMFDLKSVRSQRELEAEISREFSQAEQLFQQQDYDGALQRLDSILQRNPDHTRSLELKKRIEEARNPATPEGAGEAPGEPATP
jgi:hypothetical protein